MAWPTDQDYRESIQNPKIAFADAELQSGQVETDAMGLPRPRSGNFATVYKVVTTGGVWAVKCFRYDNPEHNRRYPIIASHLGQHPLSYMVSFRYMSEGMRVGPNKFPLLKMKWLDGERLDTYIERNLSSRSVLSCLAADWVKMLTELRDTGIAHGDLQDRNVLVVQGALRLVDYDGMYVPALEGSHGLEIGAQHYQHPQRTALDFGPYLDNFSAWLVYCSIVALAAQPSLWSQLRAGDDCLLFRKKDFEAPEQSRAFQLLKALSDPRVSGIAQRLEDFLWLPPDQVPAINEQEIQTIRTTSSATVGLSGSSWIEDYVHDGGGQSEDEFPDINAIGDTWLDDHVENPIDVGSFTNNVWVDRTIAVVGIAAASAMGWWLSFVVPIALISFVWIGGLIAAAIGTLVWWYVRWRRQPIYASLSKARRELSGVNKEHRVATGILDDLRETRVRHRKTSTYEESRLQVRYSGLRSDEEMRLKAIEDGLQKAMQHAGNQKRTITATEGAEKRKLAESIGSELARISHALSALPGQEQAELARATSDIQTKANRLSDQLREMTMRRVAEHNTALKEYQDQVVNGHLQRVRIADATIAGIGPELKKRLALAGFVSAGDIGTRKASVPGIGATKWASLRAWRTQVERPVRAREAPTALPSHKSAAIDQRYGSQIRQLELNVSQENGRLNSARQTIRSRFADQKRTLESEKAGADARLRQESDIVEKKFNQQRRQIIADEQTTREQSQKASAECRSQFRAASQKVTEEADQMKKAYRSALEQMNSEILEAAKRVQALSRRQNQAQRRCSGYKHLGFRRYVLTIMRGN